MTTIETAPADADVTVEVTGDLIHQCPFREEEDHGFVTITWRCAGATLELHSLAAYLNAYEQASLSHEAITDLIRHDLSVISGVELLEVVTTWTTAGMEVSCSTSPTPAATLR